MIALLKCIVPWARRMRPAPLTPGTIFEIGAAVGIKDAGKCRWQVRRIQHFLDIAHATIEQPETGKTKTVAVSSILNNPKFRILPTNE